jgi:hypothetical protein
MLEPPLNGSPYDLLPEGQSNPDAWGWIIAWDAYRLFAGQVLGEAISDMNILQGVSM